MRFVGFVVFVLVGCSSKASQAPADGPIDVAVEVDAPSADAPADAACTCEVAPPPRCQDARTLVTARAPGTCLGDACTFDTFAVTCPFGCADGACAVQACTPSCASQTCGDDGCGGTCGPCPTGTTYPGVTPAQLGIARELRVAPDGTHVATLRSSCFETVGRLDMWTVPASGAPTHRTIGSQVSLRAARFTDNGYLVYGELAECTSLRTDLWAATLDGATRVPLALKTFLTPTVAGKHVYFQADDPQSPQFGDRTVLLERVRVPDGQPQVITRMKGVNPFGVAPDGEAVWVQRDVPLPDLVLYRSDGSFVVLVATPLERRGLPVWSPDGKRLVYAVTDRRISKTALYLVERGQPVLLDADCNCGETGTIAFASDGAQLAWLAHREFDATQDVIVHRFAGGADLRIAGLQVANDRRAVGRFTFSVDNTRLYAAVGDALDASSELRTAAVANGNASSLGSARRNSFGYAEAWDEAPGAFAFAAGDDTTRVITAAGTQVIAGSSLVRPRFEPAATPRLLVQHDTALSVYPTAGTGAGVPLAGFAAPFELAVWAENGEVPFVFGWAAGAALYPAAVSELPPFTMVQDVMAWTTAAQGRLAARVIRYQLAGARIFAITLDQGFFVLPRP